MSKAGRRALVLGGGGVAGIAWETGVLFGLAEGGVDVTHADLMVGTSAGSAVAAQVGSGEPLATLYDRQVFGAGTEAEIAVELDLEQMVAAWTALLTEHAPGPQLRAAIGSYALAAPTVPERRRREVIEARLPARAWPARDIRIVAVDAASGAERVFTSSDEVELVDAVAASCAVPGIWPPVTIQGRRYVDGGIRSSTNLDLAAGCEAVLVLAPSPEMGAGDPAVVAAREELERSARVLTIRPDEASVAAIGSNPLDPATAKPAAQAGRAQAAAHVERVRELWAQ
ncbi:MAG TPA: patatin-like phospholipase family protein [Mycobacteriales bacterium]|nr:patatin-like phospholipase family protein [Mycobacteriales bacterium]